MLYPVDPVQQDRKLEGCDQRSIGFRASRVLGDNMAQDTAASGGQSGQARGSCRVVDMPMTSIGSRKKQGWAETVANKNA